jgi:hypothetical protein
VGGTPFEQALGAITSFDVLNVVPSLSLAAVGVAAYATVAALGVRLRTVAAGLAVVAVVAGLAWRRRRGLEATLLGVLTRVARATGRRLPRVRPPDRSPAAANRSAKVLTPPACGPAAKESTSWAPVRRPATHGLVVVAAVSMSVAAGAGHLPRVEERRVGVLTWTWSARRQSSQPTSTFGDAVGDTAGLPTGAGRSRSRHRRPGRQPDPSHRSPHYEEADQ